VQTELNNAIGEANNSKKKYVKKIKTFFSRLEIKQRLCEVEE